MSEGKRYYDDTDDIPMYWELRYREWLKNPNWPVFKEKQDWFDVRFDHILPLQNGPITIPDSLGGSGWNPSKSEVLLSFMENRHYLGESVFEVGCGSAMYAVPLLKRFKYYYGVDTSPTALKIAELYYKDYPEFRKRMHLYCSGPLGDLDWIFNNPELIGLKVDCVVTITVLQHQTVDRRARMINAIKNRLKPGGVYIGLEWVGHSDAYDMPPMDDVQWREAWEPMEIVRDNPPEHPKWVEDNVWIAR
jgi:SAM-dependent methyltransferase